MTPPNGSKAQIETLLEVSHFLNERIYMNTSFVSGALGLANEGAICRGHFLSWWRFDQLPKECTLENIIHRNRNYLFVTSLSNLNHSALQ